MNFVAGGGRREVWPASRSAIREGASPILTLLCLAASMPLAIVALKLNISILSPTFTMEHSREDWYALAGQQAVLARLYELARSSPTSAAGCVALLDLYLGLRPLFVLQVLAQRRHCATPL